MTPTLFAKMIFKMLTLLRKPDLKWKLKRMFPLLFFFPHMCRDEFFFFKKICKNAGVFLEYGSGGSTIYLLRKEKLVYSVESNHEFYEYMNSITLVKKSLGKNLLYKFVDLGFTNQWGKPLETTESYHWKDYYSEIWRDIDPVINKIDVVFIDGRFRVCCCLYSISKLLEYNWKNTVFVIHDFWARSKYHVVLEFLDEIKSVSNLTLLRLKKNIDINRLAEMTEQNALVTA